MHAAWYFVQSAETVQHRAARHTSAWRSESKAVGSCSNLRLELPLRHENTYFYSPVRILNLKQFGAYSYTHICTTYWGFSTQAISFQNCPEHMLQIVRTYSVLCSQLIQIKYIPWFRQVLCPSRHSSIVFAASETRKAQTARSFRRRNMDNLRV